MASADDRKETSLRACVAYMLDIDVSEVPTKREANMGQWLALRNLGLVPVASPETFQWPGLFLGLRRDTSTWAVYFGVPPGIVHDPMAEPDGKGTRRWTRRSCSRSRTRDGAPRPVLRPRASARSN